MRRSNGSGHSRASVLTLDKVLLALNLPLPIYLGKLVLVPDLCELVGEVIAELLLGTGRRRAEEHSLRLGEFLLAERTAAPEFLQLYQFVNKTHDRFLCCPHD